MEWAERVRVRLEKAESQEFNQHFKCDIHIAWLTALYAARGNPQPHIDASYKVLGLHPDKVWPAIVARRKAQLESEYSLWYDANGNSLPQVSSLTVPTVRRRSRPVINPVDELGSIKKPCASTKRERRKAA